MPQFQNIPKIKILAAGAALTAAEIERLLECTVEQSIGAPDVITMRFTDPDFKLADSSKFALGTEIEVKMAQGDEANPPTVTKCEVFSVEPNFTTGRAPETVVYAFHKMNRLQHGRKTRTFLDVKDSDVVSTLIQGAGLNSSIDATDTTYKYLVQWNQTDMEFLRERAARIGYLFHADQTSFYFEKWNIGGQPALVLSPDDNLTGFRPRLSLAQQVGDVKVRAWDPQAKAAIEGAATVDSDLNQGGTTTTGSSAVASAYGQNVLTIVDPTAKDVSDAQAIATGYLAQLTREHTEAEADCPGDAKLRPGAIVQVKDVGARFSGKYMITTARHVLNSTGYGTTVTMTGGYPERIGDMLGATNRSQRMAGVMPAVVTNLADPENKGRIKVSFKHMPQNNGVDLESGWMRLMAPMAGKSRGFQFYPEVGDEVLVAFEGGEPAQGIIIGGLWNGQDTLPSPDSEFRSESQVKKRTLKSMAGHEITFAEDDGSDLSVTVKDVKGNTILLDSKNEMLKITAVKDMTIDVTGDLKITAKGNINVESSKNLDMKATQNATISATQNLELKATQNATLKATSQVSVEGTAGATVKSSATLQLSGTAMAELKGALVKIN